MDLLLLTYGLIFMVTLVSSVMVVVINKTFYSAVALIVMMCAIAANFLLMKAELIAWLQLMVYAGAIMVLFLTVITLMNIEQGEPSSPAGWPRRVMAALLALIFVSQVTYIAIAAFANVESRPTVVQTIDFDGDELQHDLNVGLKQTAKTLYTRYLLAFELTSVLLLVAIIGAIAIGLKTETKYQRPKLAHARNADAPDDSDKPTADAATGAA